MTEYCYYVKDIEDMMPDYIEMHIVNSEQCYEIWGKEIMIPNCHGVWQCLRVVYRIFLICFDGSCILLWGVAKIYS